MFGGQLFSNKGVLNYEQTVSLKSICVVNIVAKLWINEKVELEKCIYGSVSETDVEDIILTKIKHLPRVITGQLAPVVDIVGNAIRSWIEFHDKYLFEYYHHLDSLEKETKRDELSVKYLHFLKFTNNGMIDQLKTAKNIAVMESNLNLKYKLASHYCLEEEFKNIPLCVKTVFFQSFTEEVLVIEECPMLFYWTYQIMPHQLLYEKLRINNDGNKSLREYIIDAVLDLDCPNESLYFEVAIKHLWGKLSNTEKSKKRVISVIQGLENTDLKYSFLSSLDYNQQQIIFKDISFSFLKNMLYDLMWRYRFVSTTYHIFDMLDHDIYSELLDELGEEISYHLSVNDKFCNVQCYKEILKALWERTPYPFKEYVFKQNNGKTLIILTSQLKWDVSFDLIQMLLDDMPETDKKNAIYSDTGLDECIRYIEKENWVLLDLYIKSFLVTVENQIEFKEYLVSKSVMKICFHHFDQEHWDKINYFLNWAFKSTDEIDDFKKSIRMTRINEYTCKYNIYSSQNAADIYTRCFPSEQSLKKFKNFFLKK